MTGQGCAILHEMIVVAWKELARSGRANSGTSTCSGGTPTHPECWEESMREWSQQSSALYPLLQNSYLISKPHMGLGGGGGKRKVLLPRAVVTKKEDAVQGPGTKLKGWSTGSYTGVCPPSTDRSASLFLPVARFEYWARGERSAWTGAYDWTSEVLLGRRKDECRWGGDVESGKVL